MVFDAGNFAELEERIFRAIELIKSTRLEKEAAQKQLIAAQAHIERLERELNQLRREQDLVRNKVEALLETLSEITEEPIA